MPRSTTCTPTPAAPPAVAERLSPDSSAPAPEARLFTWVEPQAELVAALAALVRYHLRAQGAFDEAAAAAPLAPAA